MSAVPGMAMPMPAASDTATATTRRSQRSWSLFIKSERLPFTSWMRPEFKNHFVAAMGEYVGTTMYLFLAFAGTMVAHIPYNSGNNPTQAVQAENMRGTDPSILLYIALSFGFSLAVNVWVFFRVSGGLFNPAITFAFALAGVLNVRRAGCVFVAQMLGGVTAAAIVEVLFPAPLDVGTDLNGGTSIPQGLFIEMFLTAELIFTVFMLAAEKHRATFLAPIGIGLVMFVIELVGVYFTGGSVNPARSFGPCVVKHQFPSVHWIYWVGPGLGALLAAAFYKLVKVLEYENANPGQDDGPSIWGAGGDDDDEKKKKGMAGRNGSGGRSTAYHEGNINGNGNGNGSVDSIGPVRNESPGGVV